MSLAERINLYDIERLQISKYDLEDVRIKAILMMFRNGKEELSIKWPHHPIGNSR